MTWFDKWRKEMTTTPVQESLAADKGSFTHELQVLQKVHVLLGELDAAARHRVLEYVIKRHEADQRAVAEMEKAAAYGKHAAMEKELAGGALRGASAGLRNENATRY